MSLFFIVWGEKKMMNNRKTRNFDYAERFLIGSQTGSHLKCVKRIIEFKKIKLVQAILQKKKKER